MCHPTARRVHELVTYSAYDPRGHAGRKIDGPHDLTYTYGRAERQMDISETRRSSLKFLQVEDGERRAWG